MPSGQATSLRAHAFGCSHCVTALVNVDRPLGSASGFVELHALLAPECNGVLFAHIDEGAPLSLRQYLRAEVLELLRWKAAS